MTNIKFNSLILAVFVLLIQSGHLFAEETGEKDPLEGINRSFFVLNETLDKFILRPVAVGYRAVMPGFAEKGVNNFFSNLGEVGNVVNDVLQGKVKQAGNDGGRFIVNTTLGVAGLFDVASPMGLEKSDGEDFGQTLAVWGVGEGPYLMLPLLGPSNLRDAPSGLIDRMLSPTNYIDDVATENTLTAVEVVSLRASLLDIDGVVSGDKYLFMRDVFIQRREYLINDGEIEDDFGDLEDY